MTNVTTVEWTHAGRIFGITINPADVDRLIESIREGPAPQEIAATESSKIPSRAGIERGVMGMIKRGEHAKKETAELFGASLLWLACTSPEPHGPRFLRRAREGGSKIVYEFANDGIRVLLLNPRAPSIKLQ